MRRLFAAFGGDKGKWEFIGDNRNINGIPSWVISAFAKMPGSHGTRLIDYPETGEQLFFRGRRYPLQGRHGRPVMEGVSQAEKTRCSALRREAALNDRDYIRGPHPPACTCVDCVNEHLRRMGRQPSRPRPPRTRAPATRPGGTGHPRSHGNRGRGRHLFHRGPILRCLQPPTEMPSRGQRP